MGTKKMTTAVNIIKNSYDDGACPDCSKDIPDDVDTGDGCSNCGHAFYASVDWRHDADQGKTEEICDECGSTNIGYDAWVKKIGGELVVVGGPFDNCQCLNEYCYAVLPGVRSVPVQSLKYCDGQDCYYQGDKEVMTNTSMDSTFAISDGTLEPYKYWYCTRCIKEANSPEKKESN